MRGEAFAKRKVTDCKKQEKRREGKRDTCEESACGLQVHHSIANASADASLILQRPLKRRGESVCVRDREERREEKRRERREERVLRCQCERRRQRECSEGESGSRPLRQ
jgi:hypothetical protein